MQTDKFLIVGSDGFLGSALKNHLIANNESVIESTRRKDTCTSNRIYLDLSVDIEDDWMPPPGVSVVYLCAAVTSLEVCRTNPIQSARVNVYNTAKIAQKCIENGAFAVFPSSNLVFDGTVPLRKPDDTRSPRTTYGGQKAETEGRLLVLGNGVAIVRFTKIITPDLPLIVQWIESLELNRIIHPFSDYVMAPVSMDIAVECLYRIGKDKLGGIYHVSAPKDVSYADAAYRIGQRLKVSPDLISPVKIKDAGITLEHNPKYTALDSTKIEKLFRPEIPGALSTIDEVFFS